MKRPPVETAGVAVRGSSVRDRCARSMPAAPWDRRARRRPEPQPRRARLRGRSSSSSDSRSPPLTCAASGPAKGRPALEARAFVWNLLLRRRSDLCALTLERGEAGVRRPHERVVVAVALERATAAGVVLDELVRGAAVVLDLEVATLDRVGADRELDVGVVVAHLHVMPVLDRVPGATRQR